MNRSFAFLLPVTALVVVLVVAGAARLFRDDSSPAAMRADVPAEQDAEPIDAPQPRRATGDVCQGVIKRPGKGQPTAFPAEYTQQRHVLGLTIVGNARVQSAAFDRAEETIRRMFAGNGLEERAGLSGARSGQEEQCRAGQGRRPREYHDSGRLAHRGDGGDRRAHV